MRLGLALGAAVIATTVVAYADSEHRGFVFHRGEHVSADANNDGWLSRDEADADADRLFGDLDRDNNGRINDTDHELLEREIEAEVERAMEGVEAELENMEFEFDGLDEAIEARLQFLDENCETTTENSGDERRVTTVCRDDEGDDRGERGDRAERRVERRAHVIRHDGDRMVPPVPPIPPAPPIMHAPMIWMGGDDEADLNGDGALSREEFRAQQLRYFDARDANGDGRVRFEEPPEPPEAPEPPTPPRRHH